MRASRAVLRACIMADLLDIVVRTIEEYRMTSPGEKVLAAVSGGPDSMAMLYALDALKDRLGITLAVAHLDHGLRENSANDALFVEAAAANLGLELVSKRVELKEALGPGVNKQALAREARYAFLEEAADGLGAHRIAVAHTMDDQAETYLMRELRGSGARGLASIPPVRGRVIRPLIDAGRESVMGFLGARGIGFCVDPTNLKTDYLRNRLRLELMPKLREYNPNVTETLARGARIMRDEDDFLDSQAAGALDGLTCEEQDWLISLDLRGMMGLHPAMKRRVVRLAVERLAGGLLGVGFGHVEDALALLAEGGTGRGHDLPNGVRVELSYDHALFYLPEKAPGGFSVGLPVPGSVEVPGLGVSVSAEAVDDRTPPRGDSLAYEFFDAAKLTGPLTVRSRRPGDFFYPAGMRGKKKLKEFFIDMKMPRLKRATTLVITCGDDIAWVAGLRADARFTADGAASIIRLTVTKSR